MDVDETDFDEEVMISFDVIVSRIKLRLRKNPNPNPNPNPNHNHNRTTSTAKFNFHYHRKHMVVDINNGFDIIVENNYPKPTYTVSQSTPLRFRSTLTTIVTALLNITDTDVDAESHKVIATHVLAFTTICQHKNRHSSVSIDIDIKVVSGSYSIDRDNNMLGWTDLEDAHRDLTRLWTVDDDKDYHIVKCLDNMSYVNIPCGNRGDLKAIRYNNDEVTQACTCSICLVDFTPPEEPMMNVLKMSCGHVFHLECIVSWVLSNCATPTCPLCRATMEFL